MTCTEARGLFSALADEALTPAERAALDAHLPGCADCRRELESFARTVRLVRAMPPARAPTGFGDRVLAAARPTPRPRPLARRLLHPWLTLPLSTAALLLIGSLAALLLRGSPEQQRVAQYRSDPPPGPATPAAPPPAKEAAPPAASEPGPPASEPAPPAAREPAPPAASESAPPAAPVDERAKSRVESPRSMAKRAETSTESAKTTTESADTSTANAETSAERNARARDAAAPAREMADQKVGRPPLSRTDSTARLAAGLPDVTAQLRATDVRLAERSLVELAGRAGGRQTGRRIDGGRVVVELAVPSETYAEFMRQAAALGAVTIDRQATDHSVLAVAVTVSK